ncbi:hypothetical protein A6280_25665 [Bacillus wiedmannii]|uniref:class III lanthipeptide n=1 Tax=Bacillus wiedmannii TaxID=1890302 RepID=UPI0007DB0C4F|nr:class III lanthipeptide [Bacillus wiedmannii]OAK08757.1 hypothetical protein A6280_25665 [Bacillus wiedmannii]
MKKLLSLQHTALDKEVVLLKGKSSVSLGCDNISTVSLYFCGNGNFTTYLILILKEINTMKKLLSLQHTALDKEVVLLKGKSSVSLGCDNISTVSLYFCGN